ncbi:MAG TPA: LacI family DNA-binding transcriptional regulator [Candidatus Methylacidiphilales bacterium]
MSTINQQVIADRLSISRTTVSRCFTNHKGINPKTRAEVFSLAAQLGYQYLQPRVTPKNSTKTRSIGVLICSDVEEFNRPDYESPGIELLPGVAEFAQLHNWQTEVHLVSPTATSIADASYAGLQSLKKRLWSGLLLIYPFPHKIIGELTTRFPCVSLVEQYGQVSVDCVDVNHHKGITALIDVLREQGHTRIGFLSRIYAVEAAWSFRRCSGYVEHLVRLGMPYRPQDVSHIDISSAETASEGYDRVEEQMRDGVTAWVCAADHQAYDLIAALKERGYHVPADVSVTGFDGILRPAGAPELDTIRIPYYEIGFAAGRRLLDKINKRYEAPQEILLECRLQKGETVGPCPALRASVH